MLGHWGILLYLRSCVLQNWSQTVDRRTLLCFLFLRDRRKIQGQNHLREFRQWNLGMLFNLKMNNSSVQKHNQFYKGLWRCTNLAGSEPGPGVVVGVGVDRRGLAISSSGICKVKLTTIQTGGIWQYTGSQYFQINTHLTSFASSGTVTKVIKEDNANNKEHLY